MLNVDKLHKHLTNLEGLAGCILDEAAKVRNQLGEMENPKSRKKEEQQLEINAMLLRRQKSFKRNLKQQI